jgi:hypothetical protein
MRSTLARGERGFRVFTLVLALAFTLQSFVTQTHIHGSGSAGGDTNIVKVLKGPAPAQSPLDSSDNACAFCQAIAHSGAFFAPVAPVVLPPSVWTMPALLPIVVSVSHNVLAHSWQSRAPPKA